MAKLSDKRPAFFMVEDIVFECGLTPYEGWVYMAILKHANRQTGVAFPGMATLVKICCMSKMQIIRAIKSLEKKGIIEVERDSKPVEGEKRERKANHYTVVSLAGSNHQLPGVVTTSDNNQSKETKVKEQEKTLPNGNGNHSNDWYDAIKQVWGYEAGRNGDTSNWLSGKKLKPQYKDYPIDPALTPDELVTWSKDWRGKHPDIDMVESPAKVQDSILKWRKWKTSTPTDDAIRAEVDAANEINLLARGITLDYQETIQL